LTEDSFNHFDRALSRYPTQPMFSANTSRLFYKFWLITKPLMAKSLVARMQIEDFLINGDYTMRSHVGFLTVKKPLVLTPIVHNK